MTDIIGKQIINPFKKWVEKQKFPFISTIFLLSVYLVITPFDLKYLSSGILKTNFMSSLKIIISNIFPHVYGPVIIITIILLNILALYIRLKDIPPKKTSEILNNGTINSYSFLNYSEKCQNFTFFLFTKLFEVFFILFIFLNNFNLSSIQLINSKFGLFTFINLCLLIMFNVLLGLFIFIKYLTKNNYDPSDNSLENIDLSADYLQHYILINSLTIPEKHLVIDHIYLLKRYKTYKYNIYKLKNFSNTHYILVKEYKVDIQSSKLNDQEHFDNFTPLQNEYEIIDYSKSLNEIDYHFNSIKGTKTNQ